MFCSFPYAYPRTEPHKAITCDKLEKALLQGSPSSLLSLPSWTGFWKLWWGFVGSLQLTVGIGKAL